MNTMATQGFGVGPVSVPLSKHITDLSLLRKPQGGEQWLDTGKDVGRLFPETRQE